MIEFITALFYFIIGIILVLTVRYFIFRNQGKYRI